MHGRAGTSTPAPVDRNGNSRPERARPRLHREGLLSRIPTAAARDLFLQSSRIGRRD